jgi:hypothetical protein
LTETGNTSAGCAPYPYSAGTESTSAGDFARFFKPLNYQTNAQAVWDTTFLYTGNTIPPVYMDLDGDTVLDGEGNPVPRPEFQLMPCDSTWYTNNGTFIGPPNSDGVPNPYACLISAVKGKKVGSSNSAIYSVYVYGDAVMRR